MFGWIVGGVKAAVGVGKAVVSGVKKVVSGAKGVAENVEAAALKVKTLAAEAQAALERQRRSQMLLLGGVAVALVLLFVLLRR